MPRVGWLVTETLSGNRVSCVMNKTEILVIKFVIKVDLDVMLKILIYWWTLKGLPVRTIMPGKRQGCSIGSP